MSKKTDSGFIPLDTIVSGDKPDFIENFLQITKDKLPQQVAEMVWNYGNERWTKGYNQGKYDPDFANE